MSESWNALFEKFRCQTVWQNSLQLLDQLKVTFAELAQEYNRSIAEEALMVNAERMNSPERLLVTTMLWTLSIRVCNNAVECFLFPTAEVSALMEAELPSRCKLRLVHEAGVLTVDGTPLNNHELGTLLRSLLKDLIVRSKGEFEQMPDSARLVLGGQSLTGSVKSLVAEKHILVQKIVNQQEQILAQVTRELHDAVLGNMMVLERSLSGGKQLSNEEMISIVKEASTQLREICHELFPRDLKDCGLAPMLDELCKKLEERVGCKCSFKCSGKIPELPDEVVLHIYRIAQECCNNIAKHASATNVNVSLEYSNNRLSLAVDDDGKGYESDSARAGTGSSSIRERTELINLHLAAALFVTSKPGQGTKVSLQLTCTDLAT